MIDDSRLRELVRWIRDPSTYLDEVLGVRLWSGMRLITDSISRYQRTSVRACHGISKTYTAAAIAVYFLNVFPDSIVITTAPTYRLVSDLLWKEINGFYSRDAGRRLVGRCLQTDVKVSPTWFMTGFATDSPTRAEGYHAPAILWILDEAKGIPPWIYTSAEGSMVGGYSRIIEISTTDGADQLSPFRRHHEAERDRWNCIHLSAVDSPFVDAAAFPELAPYRNRDLVRFGKPETGTEWSLDVSSSIQLVTEEWIRDRIGAWKGSQDDMIRTKVLGDFEDQSASNLIPLAWILSAVEAEVPEGGPWTFGVDVARMGPDSTVVVSKRGGTVVAINSWSKTDLETTTNRIREISRRRGIVQIDAVGIGAGVYDRIASLGDPVRGLDSGEKATDQIYKNRRAELWFSARELFRLQYTEGGVLSIPDDPILIEDLAGIRYSWTSSNQYQIERKEDYRKRLGRSPDRGDALVYATYDEPPQPPDVFQWADSELDSWSV